jgi:hypothetical protein
MTAPRLIFLDDQYERERLGEIGMKLFDSRSSAATFADGAATARNEIVDGDAFWPSMAAAAPLWPVASVVGADDARDVHGRLTAKNRHCIAGIDESQIRVRSRIDIEFTLSTSKAKTF